MGAWMYPMGKLQPVEKGAARAAPRNRGRCRPADSRELAEVACAGAAGKRGATKSLRKKPALKP